MTRLDLPLDFCIRQMAERLVLRLSAGRAIKNIIKISGFLILLFLIYVNIFRFLNFALNIAGIEHDSGWYLGVARNLAFRGKYASYTNTVIKNFDNVIARDMWGRMAVVGKDDLEYFPPGVTVGPAFIAPVSLIIRLFGAGYWQFRLFPILTYFLLLGVMGGIVYKCSGIIGTIFLMMFLNLFPHLVIPLAFEAFAEPTGFLYQLLGLILLTVSLKERNPKKLYPFLGGIFISLSCLTKTLYFLSFISTLFIYFYLLQKNIKKYQKIFFFVLGSFIPVFLFESYRFFILFKIAGMEAYLANLKGQVEVFLMAGSGFGDPENVGNLDFLLKKLNVFSELGVNDFPLILLALICFLSLFAQEYVKNRKERNPLFWLIFISWFINLNWFLFVSSNGWARHFWSGLALSTMILSIFLGESFSKILGGKNLFLLAIGLFLLFSIYRNSAPKNLFKADLGEEILVFWRDKFYSKRPLPLPLPIFPQAEQKPLAAFIINELPPQSEIYHVGGLLVAEIPPLVDRIFYPVERLSYENDKEDYSLKYVIFGPYQVSSLWRIISFEQYAGQLTEYCRKEIFSNDYYKICLLE